MMELTTAGDENEANETVVDVLPGDDGHRKGVQYSGLGWVSRRRVVSCGGESSAVWIWSCDRGEGIARGTLEVVDGGFMRTVVVVERTP
ncbi:uncharacterized protein PITG_09110 [Phytophthora infestans T30-4]|uniref:Uncharacterized protein n=1 Tax=Phytophthora infestans (strain T30-4) TaxID=403677 RepID=D0NBQ6_PHYIT|nr:uncharacterized protein PITG_09110 [Phytophthora infestans T30-4]EEY55211.1 hypothetical protein PITG_09110 [Phytophthora infestans T30-4]|eukprot:XP_002903435.1 hypothetical protein PITG_09110 [Phytophthora infestans T30-4]